MPKIRWKVHTKLQTKALGLEGAPRTTHAVVGEEMDVPDSAIPILMERCGPDTFEVITKEPAPAPEKEKKK